MDGRVHVKIGESNGMPEGQKRWRKGESDFLTSREWVQSMFDPQLEARQVKKTLFTIIWIIWSETMGVNCASLNAINNW